jgi:hypothetical protein
MQGHGRAANYEAKRRAVQFYYINERSEQWIRRDPGGRWHIRVGTGDDRIIADDASIRDRVPGKYETEADAEAVARSLFPNARRL